MKKVVQHIGEQGLNILMNANISFKMICLLQGRICVNLGCREPGVSIISI